MTQWLHTMHPGLDAPVRQAERVCALRVALDATPLFGARTGVAMFTSGVLGALATRGDVEPSVYAVTWRGRGEVGQLVPQGVGVARSPMAARPLRWAWQRWNQPPLEWWTGEVA